MSIYFLIKLSQRFSHHCGKWRKKDIRMYEKIIINPLLIEIRYINPFQRMLSIDKKILAFVTVHCFTWKPKQRKRNKEKESTWMRAYVDARSYSLLVIEKILLFVCYIKHLRLLSYYSGNFLVCTYIQTILLNVIVTCKHSLAHSEDLVLY